jgi:outer membrane protein
MKLNVTSFAVVAGLVLGTQIIFAQTKPVTLNELLKQALSENYSIQVSELEEQRVDRQIQETRAKTLPQINGNGNVSDNFQRQVMVLPSGLGGAEGSGPTKIVAGTKYVSAVGVEASQPILDMAAISGLKASKAAKEYSVLSTKQTKEEIINTVAKQYYQVLSAMEEVKLQQQTVLIIERLIRASEGQYENGLMRKTDLDRMRVNLINTQSKLTQAQNDVSIKTNQLKVYLGMSLSNELVLDTLALREPVPQMVRSSSLFSPEAQTEVTLLNSEIRLNTLQRNAIRAEYYPKLNGFINYSYNSVSNDLGETLTGKNDAITYGMGTFGVRLQVPIFSGFSRNARVAQGNIKIQQLERQREAKVLELDARYQSAGIQMANTMNTLAAQKENVALSNQVYNSTRANYTLGLSSLTDLLDAQTSFLEAQNIYTQNQLNYKLAELEIMRVEGTLLKLVE